MDLCVFKGSLVYRGSSRTKINREPVSKSQNLKVKIKRVKIKPHKIKSIQRILMLYVIMFSLNYLNAEKETIAVKRYFLINAVKLIQINIVKLN